MSGKFFVLTHMAHYLPTIGMEIHVELKTASKMFSSAPNLLGMEQSPNQSD